MLPDDKDIRWFEPAGAELDAAGWANGEERALGVLVTGPDRGVSGRERAFLALNPGVAMRTFRLPAPSDVGSWLLVFDADEPPAGHSREFPPGGDIQVCPGGMVVLTTAPVEPSSGAQDSSTGEPAVPEGFQRFVRLL
jgi:pullulanase/glycogen debranching enzyme